MAKKGATMVVRCAKAANVRNARRHYAEPDELQTAVPDPVHGQDGHDIARDSEHHENPQGPQQLGLKRWRSNRLA